MGQQSAISGFALKMQAMVVSEAAGTAKGISQLGDLDGQDVLEMSRCLWKPCMGLLGSKGTSPWADQEAS